MSKYRIVESVGHKTEHVHTYEDLEIHHPSANATGLKTGKLEDFEKSKRGVPKPHAVVDGEWEEVRNQPDGSVLVKKDFILLQDAPGTVKIPAPVEGHVHYLKDATRAVRIYDRPFGEPGAKLLGQVLHMDPDSFELKEGQHVRYGQPLGVMSDSGSPGSVHAHVEVEAAQFRRYIGDIDKGVIAPGTYPGKQRSDEPQHTTTPPERTEHTERPRAASGVIAQGARGSEVWGVQLTLSKLGYTGRDGRRLTADGDFGPDTDHAVRAFQRMHGLQPVDGRVGAESRDALVEAARHPLVSEATHPSHGLFSAIARQLPQGTDPRVTANIALQAMENGITSPNALARTAVLGNDAYVLGTTPGYRTRVDMHAPTPALQDMSDHMAQQSQQAQAHLQDQARPPPLPR